MSNPQPGSLWQPGPLWQPGSPCRSSCADDRGRPTASASTILARTLRCTAILIRATLVFTRARFFSTRNRQRIARRWACLLIAGLGIRLDVHGQTPADRGPVGVLHVANHISWIDHLALLATFPLPAWPSATSGTGRWSALSLVG